MLQADGGMVEAGEGMSRTTQTQPGDLSGEVERLRAELASVNERYAAFMAATLDFWSAAHVVTDDGKAAFDVLVDLFDARVLGYVVDLEPLPASLAQPAPVDVGA